MSRLIAVHAPAAPLGDRLIISAELWDRTTYVHLARLDDEEMKRGYPSPVSRSEWQFEPGVPAAATRLTLSSGDDSLELAL